MNYSDTIAAIATGNVISAIGIVRISGADALTAADSVFCPASIESLSKAQDRYMYYGRLTDKDGELLDMCLCVVSRAPNSYTGEDTVEFHCHGSPVVLSEVLQALFACGVRLAKAGEFTKRAFLNGKMDLTQAEAVIDLIEAETPQGAKNAAGQLHGALCARINAVYGSLVDIMAHFHAVLDYPDEDIDDFRLSDYLTVLRKCESELCALLETHGKGRALRGGIPTAIIGRTNVGKSSLLNALLGYERAIVTDIHGTTRDTIEEKVLIGNVLLRLIDTAGLRATTDTVELLGVKRTQEAIGQAGLILAVFDGSEPLQDEDNEILNTLPDGVPVIVVVNKCDKKNGKWGLSPIPKKNGKWGLSPIPTFPAKKSKKSPVPFVTVSAKTGEGLDALAQEIQRLFPMPDTTQLGEIITSTRQAQAITDAVSGINLVLGALSEKISPDAVLTDLEAALSSLGEVTGKTMREDIVSRIFERFCVGK